MKRRRYIYYHELVDFLSESGYSSFFNKFPMALQVERHGTRFSQFWLLYRIVKTSGKKWILLSIYGTHKLCVIGSASELEAVIIKRFCLPRTLAAHEEWSYLDEMPIVREAVVAQLIAREMEMG